jgi:hypothetical protein
VAIWAASAEPLSDLEKLVKYAQIAGPIIALLGLGAVLIQVYRATQQLRNTNEQMKHARDDARSQQTRAYEQRYSTREFLRESSLTFAFLAAEDAGDCISRIRAWETRRHADEPCLPRPRSRPDGPQASPNDVQRVFSFFEQFATSYNLGRLDIDIVHEGFGVEPLQVFSQGWWYICWRRGGLLLGETDIFEQFQRMVESIFRAMPHLEADYQPTAAIKVLCIPTSMSGGASTPPGAWLRAQEISDLLSDHGGDLSLPLAHLHELYHGTSLDSARLTHRWQIVLVPSLTARPGQTWSAQTSRASQLASWLERIDDEDIVETLRCCLGR